MPTVVTKSDLVQVAAKAGNVSFVHFHHTAYSIASAYALLNNSD